MSADVDHLTSEGDRAFAGLCDAAVRYTQAVAVLAAHDDCSPASCSHNALLAQAEKNLGTAARIHSAYETAKTLAAAKEEAMTKCP